MQSTTLPMPTVRRYLRVLDRMTQSADFGRRCLARQMLRDMCEPGMTAAEILAPIAQVPLHLLSQLSPAEQWLRREVDGMAAAPSTSWPLATAGVRHALVMEA